MGAVYLFPGQSSQSVGMGKDQYDSSKSIFEIGNRIIGRDITDLMFNGPAEELKKTDNCQPAVLLMGLVYHSLLKKKGIKCDLSIGHSVGELAALVACGSLSLKDSLRLVKVRSEAMSDCIPKEYVESGTSHMAAILTNNHDLVYEVCEKISSVEVANVNSNEQIVISGNISGVSEAVDSLVRQGIDNRRVRYLGVEGPYHSRHMKPAADKIRKELETINIKKPKCGFIANITGDFVDDPVKIKNLLTKQVYSTVLWRDSLENAIDTGNKVFVESGFGKIQSSLVKRSYPDVEVLDKEKIIAN
jgi:[acyl-carrier-protein] S-malonyltransferase